MNDTPRSPSIDRLTLIAIAAVAHVLANIAQEEVGANVVRDVEPPWLWRAVLILVGGAAYWGTIQLSLRELVPFLGDDQGRLRRAMELSLIPHLAGGLLYVLVRGCPIHWVSGWSRSLRLPRLSAAPRAWPGGHSSCMGTNDDAYRP